MFWQITDEIFANLVMLPEFLKPSSAYFLVFPSK